MHSLLSLTFSLTFSFYESRLSSSFASISFSPTFASPSFASFPIIFSAAAFVPVFSASFSPSFGCILALALAFSFRWALIGVMSPAATLVTGKFHSRLGGALGLAVAAAAAFVALGLTKCIKLGFWRARTSRGRRRQSTLCAGALCRQLTQVHLHRGLRLGVGCNGLTVALL
jgi:hypothetical protein